MKYLYNSLTFVLLFFFSPLLADTSIIPIESISQIPTSHPPETLFFFDIDDTLLDFLHMVGSKGWRKYFSKATKERSEPCHDLISLLLAHTYPVVVIEDETPQFIRNLQKSGHHACGLTSRERQIWYDTPANDVDILTIKQLASIQISLKDEAFEKRYADFIQAPEYFEGVFFSDIDLKGGYLQKLLKKTAHWPKKIVFIDDKLSQVESVDQALTELGIAHECYLYGATDKKTQQFDPLIANIQLYHFLASEERSILSDQEARAIAQQEPEKEASYYLNLILENQPSFEIDIR